MSEHTDNPADLLMQFQDAYKNVDNSKQLVEAVQAQLDTAISVGVLMAQRDREMSRLASLRNAASKRKRKSE